MACFKTLARSRNTTKPSLFFMFTSKEKVVRQSPALVMGRQTHKYLCRSPILHVRWRNTIRSMIFLGQLGRKTRSIHHGCLRLEMCLMVVFLVVRRILSAQDLLFFLSQGVVGGPFHRGVKAWSTGCHKHPVQWPASHTEHGYARVECRTPGWVLPLDNSASLSWISSG